MTKSSYKKITKCRICKNTNLVPIINLGIQHLTGIFPKSRISSDITSGPLSILKCHGEGSICGLLQLEHSYDLEEMYGDNYGYRSGLNPSMVLHLKNKVASICKRVFLKENDLVIDIGSNDGTTLGMYPENLKLVGVDPTGDKFKKYYKPHINLIPSFFSSELIRNCYSNQAASVITSFSMFYDLEDPIGFAREISEIIDREKGIWVFEQSYMPLMLERMSYDTICHEHLEFYALEQIVWIANHSNLKVIDVELNDINGGSFSITACHQESTIHTVSDNVLKLLNKERSTNLNSLKPYYEFAEKIASSRESIRNFLDLVKQNDQTICGIGASTKGNVLLQYCGINEHDLKKIGDVNCDKFGAFTPGTSIPIVSEEEVLAENPDYLLILPWHFKNFFLTSPKYKGRKLVFPLPILQVITA